MKERAEALDRFYRVYDDSEILIYEGEDWNEASDAMRFKGGAVLYSTDSNPKPPMDVLDGDKDTRIINLSTLLNILDPEDVPLLTQMGKETRGASSVKEFLNTLVEGDVEWQEYKLVEGGKKSSPFPPKKED